jgi:hypothetical protein
LFAAALVPRVGTIAWAVVALALAVVLGRSTAQKRARIRKVAIHGKQVPARVLESHELVIRHGLASARRVTLVLEVEGRRVSCTVWGSDLEGMIRGAWLRVLTHAELPDLIVPVVSVT